MPKLIVKNSTIKAHPEGLHSGLKVEAVECPYWASWEEFVTDCDEAGKDPQTVALTLMERQVIHQAFQTPKGALRDALVEAGGDIESEAVQEAVQTYRDDVRDTNPISTRARGDGITQKAAQNVLREAKARKEAGEDISLDDLFAMLDSE